MAFLNNKFTCFEPNIKINSDEVTTKGFGTTAKPFIRLPNGMFINMAANYCHFVPVTSFSPLRYLTPTFSEYDNYRICLKFRITQNTTTQVLFSSNALASANPAIPQIYISANTGDISVDLYDNSDNLQTITLLNTRQINFNDWHYVVLSADNSTGVVHFYLYDISGNQIYYNSINNFYIKPQGSNQINVVIGGRGSSTSIMAINADISATDLFVEADGELLWGEYNDITENLGQ